MNKTKDALFVVGNGSPGGSYESDALVLDDGGNLWVAGSIKCGGGSGGYTLPPATADTLGGVMIGDNISVTADGVISVNLSEYLKSDEISDWAKAKASLRYGKRGRTWQCRQHRRYRQADIYSDTDST